MPNAAGVNTCRACGIRLCCQCNSAMPPQLGVCPQCGWWDPNWKLPFRDTDKATSAPKQGRVFTKKLDFQCAQCGANVAHDAEKCTLCGYVGHMHLRNKQSKSSMVINGPATESVQNHATNTKHNLLRLSKPRSRATRSESVTNTVTRSNSSIGTSKQSFNNRKKRTSDKAKLWGYDTNGKKFPLWMLLALVASVIILAALAVSLLTWFNTGS
jgi:ribosomal protein L40E